MLEVVVIVVVLSGVKLVRDVALQVALLVPILAAMFGLANAFVMVRLPDPESSGAADGLALG